MDSTKKINDGEKFVIDAQYMRRLVYLSSLLNADTVKVDGSIHDWKTIMNEVVAYATELQEPARPVLQDWVTRLTFMQQSSLLTAIRGPDDRAKYATPKMLLRWFRRNVLISAFEGKVLTDPFHDGGGSFTGPSLDAFTSTDWRKAMKHHVDEYIKNLDAIPAHFQNHFRQAIQIVAYKHPDNKVREFWLMVYNKLVMELNLYPESEEDMDARLSDSRDLWIQCSNTATQE